MRKDPQTALLSMGVDDACVIDNAKALVKTAAALAKGKGGMHKKHEAGIASVADSITSAGEEEEPPD